MSVKIKRGTFSKVYIDTDSEVVQIKSMDYVKECMAHGWFPDHRLFPQIRHSSVDGFDYEMKKFAIPFKKANLLPEEWEIYKVLRSFFEDLDTGDTYHTALDKLAKYKGELSADIYDVLTDAYEALTNYGADICFEISPRNCAVDENGRLVLLDCFFIKSQLEKIRGR